MAVTVEKKPNQGLNLGPLHERHRRCSFFLKLSQYDMLNFDYRRTLSHERERTAIRPPDDIGPIEPLSQDRDHQVT